MKKFLIVLLVMSFMLVNVGCSSNISKEKTLKIDALELKNTVNNWQIYTNPAFRYELRFPQNWEYTTTGEDGVSAAFYSEERKAEVKKNKETFYGSLIISSYINWVTNYDLEEFYRNQTENLFLGGYQQEEVEIDGQPGIWFKNVREKDPEHPDKIIDLIALMLDDRIIEIEVHEDWDTARKIINSINFYPGKVISDLK